MIYQKAKDKERARDRENFRGSLSLWEMCIEGFS
jgi:hypothetical protein